MNAPIIPRLGPVARLMQNYPFEAQSAAADLKRGTWTFNISPEHQVHAGGYGLIPCEQFREALQEEFEAASRASDAIVLPPMTTGKTVFRSGHKGTSICMETVGPGLEIRLYRAYCLDSDGDFYHPGKWWGSQSGQDQHGKTWSRSLEKMVCDDFGNLVEVQS